MFRRTASTCRVWAGTFAIIGSCIGIWAADNRAADAQTPSFPSTKLGQPGTPPESLPGRKVPAAPPARSSQPQKPAPGQPALPAPTQSPEAQAPPGPSLPGLGNLMTPNGIAIPGGLGFIRPGADSVGIQLNTPDGPFEITFPRRHRRARAQEPLAPEGNTDAPLFGGPGSPPPPAAGVPGAASDNRDLPADVNPADTGRHNKGSREFAHAARLFHARNYPVVLRRVNRSLLRDPGDRDLLQLRSLTYLAQGDFHSASTDALSALDHDNFWDWSTLRSLFHSADEYTALYRSLEDRVVANPNAVELRILLGYHNLMLGHRDAARRHFERVAAIDPSNDVARRMVTAEQPPQPRSEPGRAERSGAVPTATIPIPGRSQSKPGKKSDQGSPVSIELGQPTPAAPEKP